MADDSFVYVHFMLGMGGEVSLDGDGGLPHLGGKLVDGDLSFFSQLMVGGHVVHGLDKLHVLLLLGLLLLLRLCRRRSLASPWDRH